MRVPKTIDEAIAHLISVGYLEPAFRQKTMYLAVQSALQSMRKQ